MSCSGRLSESYNPHNFRVVPKHKNAPISTRYETRYDGTYDAYPICMEFLFRRNQLAFGMKQLIVRQGTVRCLPMGQPANCFSDAPFPEGATREHLSGAIPYLVNGPLQNLEMMC